MRGTDARRSGDIPEHWPSRAVVAGKSCNADARYRVGATCGRGRATSLCLRSERVYSIADSDEYRCLLELMLTGGLRIGEALGLAVCDLDRKHSVVRVECQLGRDGTRTPLKTVVHDSMHLLEAEDPLRPLVVMLGPRAPVELADPGSRRCSPCAPLLRR